LDSCCGRIWTYTAHILSDRFGSRHFYDQKIELTGDELEEINDELAKLLSTLSILGTDTETQAGLASNGHYLFNKIFHNSELAELVRSFIGRISHTSDAPMPTAVIEIVAGDFFIPWEILYPLDPDQPMLDKFLGFNVLIARQIPIQNRTLNLTEVVLPCGESPHTKIAYCNKLPAIKDVEYPYFESLNASKILKLTIMDECSDKPDLANFCRTFNDETMVIAHLACHAKTGKTPSTRFFRIRNGFIVSEKELSNRKFKVPAKALVFLNACNMGSINPRQYNSFIVFFMDAGAKSLIAPDCNISDTAAADFSVAFYEHFLKHRRRLGHSLFAARINRLIRDDGSGLAYTLYGQRATKLSKEESDGKEAA